MHAQQRLLTLAILAGLVAPGLSQGPDKQVPGYAARYEQANGMAFFAAGQEDDGRAKQRKQDGKPGRKRRDHRRTALEGAFLPMPEGLWPVGSVIVARPGATTIDVNVLAARDLRGRIECWKSRHGWREPLGRRSTTSRLASQTLIRVYQSHARYGIPLSPRLYGSRTTRTFNMVRNTASTRSERPEAPSRLKFRATRTRSAAQQTRSSPVRPDAARRSRRSSRLLSDDRRRFQCRYAARGDSRGGRADLPRPAALPRAGRTFGTTVSRQRQSRAGGAVQPGRDCQQRRRLGPDLSREDTFPSPHPRASIRVTANRVEHIGLLRDYYAWTWGDALFVVIDPYWHSKKPVDNVFGGGKKNRDMWDVTLGDTQYRWLRETLEKSDAKYKFVFTHHVLGTGRGGIERAGLFEWGGRNNRGDWEFDAKRPGWKQPIHQLMASTGVTISLPGARPSVLQAGTRRRRVSDAARAGRPLVHALQPGRVPHGAMRCRTLAGCASPCHLKEGFGRVRPVVSTRRTPARSAR